MVKGTGNVINLPNGPDVLKSNIAKLISRKLWVLKVVGCFKNKLNLMAILSALPPSLFRE